MPLSGRDAAFAMPLVFPVILLLILGAVTLASRSTNSFLAASKQTDAQAARQAAESGMNRVLRALSPYAKNVNDPYLSFLLLANWDPTNKDWPLTQLSQTAVQDRLRRCRISTRGMRTSHVVPSSSAVYSRLLSDVVGAGSDRSRVLRYRIVDYTPPQAIGPTTSPWPSQCSDFTTVSGGTAQITIEGTVEINDKPVAAQRLTRSIEVDPVPQLDLSDTFQLPGPPVGLRISNRGTALGSVTSLIYREFTQDPTPVKLTNSIAALRPQCLNCTPALVNGITNNFPLDSNGEALDMPRFPADSSGKPLILSDFSNKTAKPLTLNSVSSGGPVKVIDENSPNDPSLNCALTRNATEISCYIQDIVVSPAANLVTPYTPAIGILRIDTSKYPINLYIDGNVGGLQSGASGAANITPTGQPTTPASLPASPLNDSRVAIEHCVQTCSTTPVYYRHDDAGNNFSVRPLWSRLRIFGSKTTPQTFYIAAKSSPSSPVSLHGSFVWLPEGNLVYGVPTYTHIPFTTNWDLAAESAPGEFLASWWVKDLDFTYLTGIMSYILPVYGTAEPISAILAGGYCATSDGYCSTSGVFTEDPRFPVYPVLPRIKGTY